MLGFILFFLCAAVSQAAPVKSAAGLDFGGNGSLLFSDPSLQAFGAGAGLQGSLFFSAWNDRPIGGKMRIETVSMKEVALQKSATDYLVAGSSLKSMTQAWTLISFGAEGRFNTQGQSFFWEALLGYALGGPSKVTVTPAVPDQPLVDTDQTTTSGFALSGGIGIKRVFSPWITGLMSVRTLFLLSPTYNSSTLSSKTFIPVPLLFSIGAEVPFDLGN